MSEFVTTSKSRTVTAHGIFNTILLRENMILKFIFPGKRIKRYESIYLDSFEESLIDLQE